MIGQHYKLQFGSRSTGIVANVQVFWNTTPCRLLNNYRRVFETYRLHLQALVNICQSIRRHSPEIWTSVSTGVRIVIVAFLIHLVVTFVWHYCNHLIFEMPLICTRNRLQPYRRHIQPVSITSTNWLRLSREMIDFCFKNETEHITTACGRTAGFNWRRDCQYSPIPPL